MKQLFNPRNMTAEFGRINTPLVVAFLLYSQNLLRRDQRSSTRGAYGEHTSAGERTSRVTRADNEAINTLWGRLKRCGRCDGGEIELTVRGEP